MSVLDVWYARITFDDVMEPVRKDPVLRKRLNRLVRSATKSTSEAIFHKMTMNVNDQPRIVDQPPLLYHGNLSDHTMKKDIIQFFDAYRTTLPPERRILFDRYRLVDVAYKVVGVGSVGTRCFVTLWMADTNDPLFLQVKETRPSVLEGLAGRSKSENNGERVVVGQRVMQSASDVFLGWSRGPHGNDYYVRQLRDHKVSPDIATVNEELLLGYARLCGRTLARAC